ncbi:phage tail tape measure protein, partial [Microbacterium sp.]|uniref:phage tail tape measure protein n=1 Tax=Microbacterium sp. TaxID=51671 RepID=UPI002612AFEE
MDQLSGRLRQFGNEGAATQRSFGESIIANEQHIRAVGQTMLGAGAVITGGFGLALNSAASFEQKMNRVKALSNATGEEFELLRDRALEQGKATVFSANEAADALAFLSMAGFDVQSQYEALPGVLNLAAAAQMDLGRAADISSNILTAFG